MPGKKIFAICDLEEEYVVRLADYLNQKARLPMQVVAFTRLETLKEYLSDHPVEILLISAEAMNDDVKEMNVRRIIILSDGEDPQLDKKWEYIQKYQDSDSIARQIMRCAGEGTLDSMPEGCEIYGVYSPVGRCGKTMFSLALAAVCAEKEKTLYINLENHSGFEEIFRTTYRCDMADLMYESKSEAGRLQTLLEGQAQSFGDMFILPPAFFPDDLRGADSDDWMSLISGVVSAGAYRKIVIDIGELPADVTGILRMCSKIYMPVLADPVSKAKISQFDRNMEALSQSDLCRSMVRLYLPETKVQNFGQALIDDLVYGSMGKFVRGLLESGAESAA